MGLTPDPDGLLPKPDVQRLKEWGDEIRRRFSDPVATISGQGNQIELHLDRKQTINHVVIQEDIVKGERVRKFVVVGKMGDGWEELVSGSCIGHKFIAQFDPIEVSEVQLKIEESEAEPQIAKFSVYGVD